MRFPRLSHLFHRRVKSDPDIHRLASAPVATLETRPVSTDCIPHLALPSSSDTFTSYVPAAPYAFPAAPAQHLNHTSSLPYRASDPVTHHGQSVLAILTQRIRDLETALEDECEASACIPVLHAALQEERAARDAAEDANAALREQVAQLQEQIFQLRRDLVACSNQQPPSASTSIVASTTTSAFTTEGRFDAQLGENENAVLAVERDRLRRFVDLMVSIGGHKPVIDAAYARVVEGQDAEAALVAEIKEAVAQPDSVWRGLLEPVTGLRTQKQYLAQLRATLDARRETQAWRKRTKYWKRTAREEGRHVETVTPSVSAISNVVDVLPKERQERMEEMLVRLKEGTLPLRVTSVAVEQELIADEDVNGPEDPVPAASSSSAQSDLAVIAGVAEPSLPPDVSLPATSSSMVLPALGSTSTARLSSVYSNLPPLASETFRASYSIKSISSRRSSRRGLSASASSSTQASVKSRRRRVKIIAIPSIDAVPSTSAAPVLCAPVNISVEALSTLPLNPSTSASSSHIPRAPANINISVGSSTEDPVRSTPPLDSATFSPLPKALVDFGRGSDEDLVLVLHNDFSETSYRATPERGYRYRSGSRSSTPSSGRSSSAASSTPDKKSSRLPVRMPGLNAIKRLSIAISRPNPTLNVEPGLTRSEPPPFVAPSAGGHASGRARAATTGTGVRVAAPNWKSAGARSPTRPTKIPMGRRLQRFGFGGKLES